MIVTTHKNLTTNELKDVALAISEIDDRFNSLNFFGDNVFFLPINLSEELVRHITSIKGVDKIYFPPLNYQLSSKEWRSERTVFNVKDTLIGNGNFQIMAGPCAVESVEQMHQVGAHLQKLGINFIRGGAYKPRTSPYSFQGLETEGLKIIREIADEYGLKVITEVVDRSVLDDVSMYTDIIQIGARNMQNFFLLKELGRIDKPIFLKRGMSARIPEWLGAAEYILSSGNPKIILCERGIRTFDTSLRNTLDVAAIPLIKDLSHLPIFADPSHGTGDSKYIKPMALASIAAGCDGIMVEAHPNPAKALSDGPQSLNFDELTDLTKAIDNLNKALKA
ncbi:3-deoxy-7-phosphoheptulonate synthase [bacterium]|nr:3-deoxy-7-phosphoheptulonate synthase [bacterium]